MTLRCRHYHRPEFDRKLKHLSGIHRQEMISSEYQPCDFIENKEPRLVPCSVLGPVGPGHRRMRPKDKVAACFPSLKGTSIVKEKGGRKAER